MESELEDLNSNSNHHHHHHHQQSTNPIDEGLSNDNHPLLKPGESIPLSSPPISTVNIEELGKKFIAFVRNDVYGTMDRGELPWTKKVLLRIAFLSLILIRVILVMC
ncbi:Lysophospholipid acyltransferase LPEAT1 [Camellia lanceoleosa]|uniref:Lysophospholipid acyltransferase LPEAT1 n=1 Tax=Camellia lanceoleosa TaxID=1840588 RepID=A0ACC0HUR9_9ERIC|nr:Lysophospholipid acyltransferase LPEAT1 [Camellia lanceoleosa]